MELGYQDRSIEVVPTGDARGWYMTVDEVAKGYGVARNTVMTHLRDHADELRQGVERDAVGITDSIGRLQEKPILYRDGVIKLGFFIRSREAAAFRQWATNIIVDHMQKTGITMDEVFSTIQEMSGQIKRMDAKLDRHQDEIEELRTLLGMVLNKDEETELRKLVREVKATLGLDGRAIVGHVRKSLGVSTPYKPATYALAKNVLNVMLGRGLSTVRT
jgi:prophage antirepressor-like protein